MTLSQLQKDILKEFDEVYFDVEKGFIRMRTAKFDGQTFYKNATTNDIKSFIISYISRYHDAVVEMIRELSNATRNEVDNEKVICESDLLESLTK